MPTYTQSKLYSSLWQKVSEAKDKKKAPLNKPFRTPGGPKKFGVYVKNEKGNVVMVRFGDPNMEIKRDDPNRRKNFRARHNCDNPGPKTKARYWSCKMWERGKSVTEYTKGSEEWDGVTFWDQDELLAIEPSLASVEEIIEAECDCCPEGKCDCGKCDCSANHYEDQGDMEEKDYEPEMAVSQLSKISSQSADLAQMLEMVQAGSNIPAWIQDKISKAEHYIEAAYDYMRYGDASSKEVEAARPGPKSSAQTPAKPEEKKKGSKKNQPGSAGTKPDAKEVAEKNLKKKDEKEMVSSFESQAESITYSAKVIKSLKNKVKEHNAKYSKKVTLNQLKKVYRRGAGAFSSSHRPGKSRGQWAMARVNTFLRMARGGKVKDSYRKADGDIMRASDDFIPSEEDFIQADKDLIEAGLDLNVDFQVEELYIEEEETSSMLHLEEK
jgi:hypothetical protein